MASFNTHCSAPSLSSLNIPLSTFPIMVETASTFYFMAFSLIGEDVTVSFPTGSVITTFLLPQTMLKQLCRKSPYACASICKGGITSWRWNSSVRAAGILIESLLRLQEGSMLVSLHSHQHKMLSNLGILYQCNK